jgi:SAM-dependent methyltransferase
VTDLGGVRAHFERVLAAHGPTAEGMDFRDSASQLHRFERLVPVILDGASVCDLGCGVGALAVRLREVGYRGAYTGVDLVPASIDLARVALPDERFEVGTDPVPADVVVASGIFNVRGDIGDGEWAAHVRRTIESMWAVARIAIAFDMLSRTVSTHLFSVRADELLSWVGALESAEVTLEEDVGLAELTVVARRAQMG